MDIFLKAVAGVLVCTILSIVLSKKGSSFSLILTITVACMVIVSSGSYFKPVLDLIDRLSNLSNMDDQMLEILLKSVGIAFLAEITELICKDSGNQTLGKSIQFLSAAVILWLSVPLLNELLDLMNSIFNKI